MLELLNEICPCSANAVHTAWNCPTCNGKGFIFKRSIRELLDNIEKDFNQNRYISHYKAVINIPDQ